MKAKKEEIEKKAVKKDKTGIAGTYRGIAVERKVERESERAWVARARRGNGGREEKKKRCSWKEGAEAR